MKQNINALRGLGYFIVLLGGAFYCYEYFIRVAPSVMASPLMHAFNLNATLFGTLSAFYFYTYTPSQLVVGILVDRYRVKSILIFAVLACTVGTLLIAIAHDFTIAAIGRSLQGFGSAFAFVGGLKLAAIWLPANRFAIFSGIIGSLGFFGAGTSVAIMAKTVTSFGWRPTLFALTIIGAVLALVFALASWIATRTMGKQHSKPILLRQNMHFLWMALKTPGIWLSGLFAACMFLPTSVFAALWGVPYLAKLHHYSVSDASFAISMIFYGWGIGSIFIGWLSDFLGVRTPIMRVGAIITVILSFIVLYDQTLPYWSVCTLLLIFGTTSAVQMLSFVIAKELSTSKHAVGTSIALINTLTMSGGLLFQRGVGSILDWFWSGKTVDGLRFYTLENYKIAMAVVPISLIIAMVLSFFIKNTVKQ